MKRLFLMTMLLAASLTMNALPIDEAQREALFLTDKMAYELDLTEEQYELVYEINFDYLLSINYSGDIYGTWWARRNADLRYILSDYQYNLYIGLSYFYRPLDWRAGRWYFPIYVRYTNRSYYYRPHPRGYMVYRGGHNRIHGHYNRPIYRPHGGGRPGRIGNGRVGGGHPGGHYGGRPGGNYGGRHDGGGRPGGNYNGGNRPSGNYNGGNNGGNRPSGNYNGGNNGGNRPSGNYNGGNNGGNRPGGNRPSGNYNGGNNGGSRPSVSGGGNRPSGNYSGGRPSNVRAGQSRSNAQGRVATPGRRR